MKKAQIGTIAKISETRTRLTLVVKFPNGDTLRYYTSYSGAGISAKILDENPAVTQDHLRNALAKIKTVGTPSTQNGEKFKMIKAMIETFTTIQALSV
jgi:hypothetical protein